MRVHPAASSNPPAAGGSRAGELPRAGHSAMQTSQLAQQQLQQHSGQGHTTSQQEPSQRSQQQIGPQPGQAHSAGTEAATGAGVPMATARRAA